MPVLRGKVLNAGDGVDELDTGQRARGGRPPGSSSEDNEEVQSRAKRWGTEAAWDAQAGSGDRRGGRRGDERRAGDEEELELVLRGASSEPGPFIEIRGAGWSKWRAAKERRRKATASAAHKVKVYTAYPGHGVDECRGLVFVVHRARSWAACGAGSRKRRMTEESLRILGRKGEETRCKTRRVEESCGEGTDERKMEKGKENGPHMPKSAREAWRYFGTANQFQRRQGRARNVALASEQRNAY
ncbi:hypothetical protein B0H19DRAFT_1083291 [Mycena capillaripes]|nr:hypothetical protein B0H19DRAFT_1083291 [Mycena capillaripes]